MPDNILPEFVEFEVKFRVPGELVFQWKLLVESFRNLRSRVYIESDDIYYVKGDDFLRHRFDPKDLTKRQELTFKKKILEHNNVYRLETNVRVDGNKPETVADFCQKIGFVRNFKISKYVHIYKFDDVTLPFYTVISEGALEHFMEIEVDEDLLKTLTEEQAWAVVQKYEKLLSPLGITPQKRLRKSLFEMYRKVP